ncbi:MAG: hypothetical protein ACOY3Z_04210 [Thermodesulfobacteriota bacterium]
MGTEQRRASRTTVSFTLSVIPRDSDTGLSIGVPVAATMVDMSVYGVRLRLLHIQSGPFHLFYDFNDHPARHLDLEIHDPARDSRFVIAAHPVWFNRVQTDSDQSYELGMEFLAGPRDPGILRLKSLSSWRPPLPAWARKLLGGLGSGQNA